ncbi:hypothetical protein [Mesorhizobium sp.]|uniref:hypothetical protein n=1 Tax=Mesorhizobium sp. TaxID=1871066 RepID=UPI000FE7E265|nr:hypothetical protein [Mesorhizobium sp.]RWN31742.1 MAG: hypothetical protein EOR95_18340 [Mesorhizobium sp.]
MDSDLRSRMVTVEHKGAEHALRLTALETWKQQSDVSDARKEEQWIALKGDLVGLKTSVGEVQGTLKWIGRTIIGAIIVAVVAFMIKGGFAPPS